MVALLLKFVSELGYQLQPSQAFRSERRNSLGFTNRSVLIWD